MPDAGKREAFAVLYAQGVPSARAARMVGVNPRTAKRWRNGRRVSAGGRVYEYGPVVATPAQREYSSRYLSQDERIRLADLRREGCSMRQAAIIMGRSPSTISRELARGLDSQGRYRPFEAHRQALARRTVKRASGLARDPELRDWVVAKLKDRWSPQQISHELRRQYPDTPTRWLCAEAIYLAVYRPDLGGLPRELPGKVLHHRRRYRLKRRHARSRRGGPVTDMTMIDERPAEAVDRVEAGHWEGDLIMGKNNASAIITLVERTIRFTVLGHVPGARHDAATIRDGVTAALSAFPPELRRTLTWDQGKEMARHREIAAALATTAVFFCEPHSPWQRPSNENTNGLLRAYFPKGTDLSVHSADDLTHIQYVFNDRPRKILDWNSPAREFATLLETHVVLRR